MFQPPLPPKYMGMSPEDAAVSISAARAGLGDDLLILGHHYQRDETIRWADLRGDSFKLSRLAAENSRARHIVFCGVHFMAESADLLTSEDQVVILPNMSAGCSMADMASIGQVEHAWQRLTEQLPEDRIIPVTYVNSTAALKAFVGRHGGTCCTSSNAKQVLDWAFGSGKRVFFFPDQHLGRNTSVAMGLSPDHDMVLWDPSETDGGVAPEALQASRIILWKGHCSVHARFTVEQIADARLRHPSATVIVHPECSLDVVRAADLSGSTEAILGAVQRAPAGSVWAVGTEISLVKRLAAENPGKTVFCLDPIVCPCSTMYRIHPKYLAWVLDGLVEGEVRNQVRVPKAIRADARASLLQMLEIC